MEEGNRLWDWTIGGFKGIFGLLDRWLAMGVPAGRDAKIKLTEIRDHLNNIIARLP
jgi:hypothetical protein